MPSRSEQKFLPFRASDMIGLVTDVRRYPEFLPWCHAVRIRKHFQEGDVQGFEADMVIKFKMFTETFTSAVKTNHAEGRVDVSYVKGPFKHLDNSWVFTDVEHGCMLDFHVDFAFRNFLLQSVVTALFDEAMAKVVGAFEQRAHNVCLKVGDDMAAK
jgi:Oligoketide cyclase/lipid transport protein